MAPHVCPWWGGYFIDNRLRRLLHNPQAILGPYVQPEMTVMDFGCGMGFFAIAMAQLVGASGRVIAVDLQQQMLDVLEKRARKSGVVDRITTHRCAADSLGMSDAVDFALAFYSAHEAPDMQRLLRDIANCLRPECQLLVVEPVGHVTAKSFQEMLTLAAEVGLRLDEQPRVRLSHAALLTKAP
jgi:ubiquinone/menaquinone biosynthesis C-methylase UbiE